MTQGVEETVWERDRENGNQGSWGTVRRGLPGHPLCLTAAAELGHLRMSVCDLTKAIL